MARSIPSADRRRPAALGLLGLAAAACQEPDWSPYADWQLPRLAMCASDQPLPAGLGPVERASLADLDGDGALDVVAVGTGSVAVVYAGPERRYEAGERWLLADRRFDRPLVADFDGDGHLDVAAPARGASPELWIWLLSPQGTRGPIAAPLPPAGRWVAHDLTGDGKADLVGVSRDSLRLTRIVQDPGPGQVAFGPPETGAELCPQGCREAGLALRPGLGPDAPPELVISWRDVDDAAGLALVIVGPTLEPVLARSIPAGLGGGLVLADLDDDGLLDALSFHPAPDGRSDDAAVLRGRPDGAFDPPTVVELGDRDLVRRRTRRVIHAGELDGDGAVDLWISGQVALGDGAGGFSFEGHPDWGQVDVSFDYALGAPCSFEASALGDLDGDGIADLLACRAERIAFSGHDPGYTGGWLGWILRPTLVRNCGPLTSRPNG